MQTLALLFLAVGIANLVFAQRTAGTPWNVVIGIVGVFTGGALVLLPDGSPVVWAAVPVMLFASYMHNRVRPEEDDSIEPPV